MSHSWRLGAEYLGDGTVRFLVWAPYCKKMDLVLFTPQRREEPMETLEDGYFALELSGLQPGVGYFYRLDQGQELPDPASRSQPGGVHKPSQVVATEQIDEPQAWCGLPLERYVIYELHVGAFSPPGTFQGVIPQLDRLADLGITALELMPVAQFPGERNWGYDGVHPFAPQNTYGGPAGLAALVRACHQRGMALILDVVYNHLGPEGNYLHHYGPYFTDAYATPWGEAVNFDQPHSDHVRRFFLENARHWLRDYGMDGLRLDALHALYDFTATPFLEELSAAVAEMAVRENRRLYLFAESARNDPRLVQSRQCGGIGLSSLWNDDFHHSLRVALTGDTAGYYQDFKGLDDLATAYEQGFVYSGQYSPYRKRRHGRSSASLTAEHFVVYAQNHDQVGNRMLGERLSELLDFASLKLAAAAVILSPFLPMIFMGEEYAEPARFPYFISHQDPELVEQVRRGRQQEFASFQWQGDPPDPQHPQTFLGAKLQTHLTEEGNGAVMHAYYRKLLSLHRGHRLLGLPVRHDLKVDHYPDEQVLAVWRKDPEEEMVLWLNFAKRDRSLRPRLAEGPWRRILDSSRKRWGGPGSRLSREINWRPGSALDLSARSAVLLRHFR